MCEAGAKRAARRAAVPHARTRPPELVVEQNGVSPELARDHERHFAAANLLLSCDAYTRAGGGPPLMVAATLPGVAAAAPPRDAEAPPTAAEVEEATRVLAALGVM